MLVFSELGFVLSPGNLGFSTIWPPCGLLFAALVFSGNLQVKWTTLLLTSAASNLISDGIIHDADLSVIVGFILVNSFSSICAAIVLRQLLKKQNSLFSPIPMVLFLASGLLIQAPIAATSGLWFQRLLTGENWTWFKWLAWWSGNSLGISCFGPLSLIFLQTFQSKTSQSSVKEYWSLLPGSLNELIFYWTILFVFALLIEWSFIAAWGNFILNSIVLIFSARFGVFHASFSLTVTSVFRIFLVVSNWKSLMPFAEMLLFEPLKDSSLLQIYTIVSVQLFIVERATINNIVIALFAEMFQTSSALKESADSRSRLMARMSHEIRTPLSGVLGLIQAWAAKEESAERAEDLGRILKSASQLKRVIDDVLDFSKISAGKMSINPTLCHLKHSMEEVLALHRKNAEAKSVALELKIADDSDEFIEIDIDRMNQILNNLLSNALKFTKSGSIQVSVRTKHPHEGSAPYVQIVLEDTGIGISAEAMKKLFLPFEQVGGESTRVYGGTGLGLAICRELAELMGGSIEALSREGVGSRFTVKLPFKTVNPAHQPEERNLELREHSSHPPADRGQILVVEDDPINQVVARRLLEIEGFTVRVMDDAAEALEVLKHSSNDFKMVFMDYYMPHMDGCEVTQKFRVFEKEHCNSKCRIPIIGITASVVSSDHQRCLDSGMDDILVKPVDRRALREVIKKAIPDG